MNMNNNHLSYLHLNLPVRVSLYESDEAGDDAVVLEDPESEVVVGELGCNSVET